MHKTKNDLSNYAAHPKDSVNITKHEDYKKEPWNKTKIQNIEIPKIGTLRIYFPNNEISPSARKNQREKTSYKKDK